MRLTGQWEELADYLRATDEQLSALCETALDRLASGTDLRIDGEFGDARLRWAYGGLPELWLQCEVLRDEAGRTTSQVFQMNLP
jgi:hypothetical protein